jgi:DNA-directed RNA polymerase subunit M/transcription elongation factor TFIIS
MAEKQEAQKPEPKFFEYGDVFFECNRCGNYERLQKGVKDGMQFVLPTSDQHEWRLVCGKCKNMMRIFFKESDEETILWAKEEEKKKEALEKAKKEAEENESKKENKKEGPTEGSTEGDAGSDQSDGTREPVADLVNED